MYKLAKLALLASVSLQSGHSGGAGGQLPFNALGTNMTPVVTWAHNAVYESLIEQSPWVTNSVAMIPGGPFLDDDGELIADETEIGDVPKRLAVWPKVSGQKLLVTWEPGTETGTPHVSVLAGDETPVGSNGFMFTGPIFTERGDGPSFSVFVTGGTVRKLDCRPCDDSGVPLVPRSLSNPLVGLFTPEIIARFKSLYRGAYARNMDRAETNSVASSIGPHSDGWYVDWADRNTTHMTRSEPKEARASVVMGAGTLSFRSSYYITKPEIAGAYYPEHWMGANGNLIRLTLNAPSGAGSVTHSFSSGLFHISITPPAGVDTLGEFKAWWDKGWLAPSDPSYDAEAAKLVAFTAEGNGVSVSSGHDAEPLGTFTDLALTGAENFHDITAMPFEHQIEWARLTETKPWFNLPNSATEDFATGLATLVKNRLPAKCQPAAFEFGNEQWNGLFHTMGMKAVKAFALYGDTTQAYKIYAQQQIDGMSAIEAVLGSNCVRILGSQLTNVNITNNLASYSDDVMLHSDVVAIAPYWGAENDPDGDGPYTNLQDYRDGQWESMAGLCKLTKEHADLITGTYGKECWFYEFGADVGGAGSLESAAEIYFDPMQRDFVGVILAEMDRLYPTARKEWFIDIGALGTQKNGNYGLVIDWDDDRADVPRYEGFLRFKEGRRPPYFAVDYATGTWEVPTLSGTPQEEEDFTISVPSGHNIAAISYQWFQLDAPIESRWLDDGDDVTVSEILGETAATHTLTSADVDKYLGCFIVLTSADGWSRTWMQVSQVQVSANSRPWDPLVDLPAGCELLGVFDGADAASFTMGTGVAVWASQLGLTMTLEQPTGGDQPPRVGNEVYFDQADSKRLRSINGPAGPFTIMAFCSPSTDTGFGWVAVTSSNAIIGHINAGLYGYGNSPIDYGETLTANADYMISAQVDEAGDVPHGSLGGLAPVAGSNTLPTNDLYRVGNAGGGQTQGFGYIRAFLCFNGGYEDWSSGDFAKAGGWAAHYLGLQSLLDASHPYKATPPSV